MSQDSISLTELETTLESVGIYIKPTDLIGRKILCGVPGGVLISTIISVSNIANDDGYIELGLAPVYYRGDLVTSVVLVDNRKQKIRTEHFKEGWKFSERFGCDLQILSP